MVTATRRTNVRALSPAVAPVAAPDDIKVLYDGYRAVSPHVAPDLNATPEMARARAALIRALLDDGWDAPAIVLEQLHRDEDVLAPRLAVA